MSDEAVLNQPHGTCSQLVLYTPGSHTVEKEKAVRFVVVGPCRRFNLHSQCSRLVGYDFTASSYHDPCIEQRHYELY